MKAYFDTNILVSALQPDHVHHGQSFTAFMRVQEGAIEGWFSGQGLTELYSVLTRAPWRIAVSPREILGVIEQSIVPIFNIVGVTKQSYFAAIASCANAGWKGGRVHDAVHIQAAAQAECDVIYTYDVEHFRSLAPGWASRIRTPPAG
jgi:predicted nucleic acid-binding protein